MRQSDTMGIYDGWIPTDFDWAAAQKAALVISGVALLALIGFLVADPNSTAFGIFHFLEPNPISAQLDGPIDLTVDSDGLPVKTNAELVVRLSNPTDRPASNVSVHLIPQDQTALLVYPNSKIIETLDKTREIRFTIRPNPIQPVLSGEYRLEVVAYINETRYSQLVELVVKTHES